MTIKSITTVFWDLDGTLIDSEFIHDEAIIYACKKMGLTISDNDLLKQPGIDSVTQFEYLFNKKLTSATQNTYDAWYLETIEYAIVNLHRAKIINETLNTFKHFNKIGLKQSIVSNSNGRIIKHCAEMLGILNNCFTCISSDDVENSKPHPDVYLKAISSHAVLPEYCLAIEDSKSGIMASKSAGLSVVSVTEGNFNPAPDLIYKPINGSLISQLETTFKFIQS